MSRLRREQIFGSVTTAKQYENQNETYYNGESFTLPIMKICFFPNVFQPPKQIKWGYYYSIKKAARSNELSGQGVLAGGAGTWDLTTESILLINCQLAVPK